MTSFLEQLQLAIAAHLSRQPEFAHVPVQVIRPRSAEEATMIQTAIENALAGWETKSGRGGAAALVQMPALSVEHPNAPGPMISVSLQIRVIENPLVSMNADTGVRRSAEELATAALVSLHHYRPFGPAGVTISGEAVIPLGDAGADTAAVISPLSDLTIFAEGNCLEPVAGFDGKVVYDVTVKTKTGLLARN